MKVIGICRFSYPALGGFQVEHDSVEERSAYLYNPARMAVRFLTFEAFTLPSIKAQTDKDFTFLIVIGDSLPRRYLDRLKALTADVPQIVIQAHPPAPHRQIMKTAINSIRVFDDVPCLQFRLDDDDAVGKTFVAELRAKAKDISGLSDQHRTVAIDFNSGYIARPDPLGIFAVATQAAFWSPALAVMIHPKAKATVLNFSHHKLWRHMPSVSFNAPPMMLRGHTPFNDSRQKPTAKNVDLELLSPAGEATFKDVFGIDTDTVRRLASSAEQTPLSVEGK